ncbi:MAG: hypothetical protein WCI73_04505 [Phycisphaerae bacterium]
MRRFFNDLSFWNQPIGSHPEIDPESTRITAFMAQEDDRGFWINLDRYTIPIYEVDRNTPRRKVYRIFESRLKTGIMGVLKRSEPYLHANHPLGHGPGFAEDAAAGLIPVPDYAMPDPESDAHMSLVDWESGWIWDMWYVKRRPDGDLESCTGMKIRVDGPGVFARQDFAVHNGESIHPYGPSRAAGVPALAGTIMHQEMREGRIAHKLGFATQAAALQQFVSPPATWTDGGWLQGIPEGAVLQLDPALDLTQFHLSREALIVAKALQEYGAACVDVGGGHILYGEGLYADPAQRTWKGLLQSDDLVKIKMPHYRVLRMENLIHEGQGPRVPDGRYGGEAGQ